MNKNSLNAYFDEGNQKKFNSHCGMIIRELKNRPNQHSYLIADRLMLSNEAVKKRLSDLINKELIVVSGDLSYYGNTVSLYKINNEPLLFPVEKLTLRKWLKSKHPEILEQYEKMQ